MYIRTQEEALDAMAEILEIPDRKTQIIQATVKIMLCLDAEPRAFIYDCQVLLIEGGLEAMRRKRRELLDSIEDLPIVILDSEEDRNVDAVASALDALRLSEVVRQVFPEIGAAHERWQIARALLGNEAFIQEKIAAGIKARGNAVEFNLARAAVDDTIVVHKPGWGDRTEALRTACRDVIKGAELAPPDQVESEAETIFNVFTIYDDRACRLLDAIDHDPQSAVQQITEIHGLVAAIRSLMSKASGPEGSSGVTQVA